MYPKNEARRRGGPRGGGPYPRERGIAGRRTSGRGRRWCTRRTDLFCSKGVREAVGEGEEEEEEVFETSASPRWSLNDVIRGAV
ncbi:hypothetical protein GWI33_019795 [Rhynchophorus ferrugineus]|uniref:Uncharacterized protein n=1 Tax=Rhynchophorus ferrugineus TaxID=354439 RepID=A0A834HVI8_RHYFE|nr:hypothetical protein GWI33_019795 [Rhynchophorus ferrugineus]